jgi:hypothetical protein
MINKNHTITIPTGKIAHYSLLTLKVLPFFFTGLSFITWATAGKTLSYLLFDYMTADMILGLACFAIGTYYLVKDVTKVEDDELVYPEEP